MLKEWINAGTMTLTYEFDYEAHVFEGRCPAAQCRDLKAQASVTQLRPRRIAYGAEPESCAYCGSCLTVCPNDHIHAEDET